MHTGMSLALLLAFFCFQESVRVLAVLALTTPLTTAQLDGSCSKKGAIRRWIIHCGSGKNMQSSRVSEYKYVDMQEQCFVN